MLLLTPNVLLLVVVLTPAVIIVADVFVVTVVCTGTLPLCVVIMAAVAVAVAATVLNCRALSSLAGSMLPKAKPGGPGGEEGISFLCLRFDETRVGDELSSMTPLS